MTKDRELRMIYNSMGVIHCVGIGGIGMSGIAEVLFNMGCTVQGSDSVRSTTTAKLETFGIKIFIGHCASHIVGCDVVVVSSAVAADNPEITAARERKIPVIKRAEMLAELMRFHFGIAVSGSHGKTTTTSLIAAILSQAGLDPTFIIGGKVNSCGRSARLGESPYMVAEADESDASFLHLQPLMSVITNIDTDHLTTYQNSFELLQDAFVDFVHNLPFYGVVIVCNDDAAVCRLLPRLERRCVTYGCTSNSHFRAENLHLEGMRSVFELRPPGASETHRFILNLPGLHNVLNALAAIAVAVKLGIGIEIIATALAEFQGIRRRLQDCGILQMSRGNVRLIDDYGHHPNEIRAVLCAIANIGRGRRKVLIFQPHRYTRTHALFNDFCAVLSEVDALILLDVYAAGEAPIKGSDSGTLNRAIQDCGLLIPIYLKSIEAVPEVLDSIAQDGDMVVTMGAGSIANLPKLLAARFAAVRARQTEGS